jgi:hypothetical protein
MLLCCGAIPDRDTRGPRGSGSMFWGESGIPLGLTSFPSFGANSAYPSPLIHTDFLSAEPKLSFHSGPALTSLFGSCYHPSLCAIDKSSSSSP